MIDLHRLNRHIHKVNYRLPTTQKLRVALPEKAWLTKLDIKDAYFHVPVNNEFRRYLAFEWNEEWWQFRVMPFGLTTAPAVFTG